MEISPLNNYVLAINQNGGIFVFGFRFSENPFCVTQDSGAVEKEKKRITDLCGILNFDEC